MAGFDSLGNPLLEYGANSGAVSDLKQKLNWWGYYDQAHPDAALGPDIFGWDVAEALQRLQGRYGLETTGRADSQTWWLIDQLQRGVTNPQPFGQDIGALPTAPYETGPGTRGGATGGANSQTGPLAPELNRDALGRLGLLLQQYGLSGMLDWVRGKLIAGASEAEISLELYDQPAFKARFPVIEARRAAGLTPVSVAEVLEYETRGRELMRQAGLTGNQFTSSSYLQGLMGQDVSLSEVQERLQDGLLRVQNAPAEVRTVFGSYFGTNGDAALAQLFLDPERALPELEKMAATAVAGGIGQRFGVQIAQGIAREIADTGASDAAIWQGFATLDSMRDLFRESISETQDLTVEGEGVSSVFGTQPGAQKALTNRVQQRTAAFRGGGSAASTDQGVVGLGVADR